MSDLQTSFEKLLKRQPTDAEVQRLYQIRDALELKNNDALWLVLMALQHYETSYEQMPKAIETAAASVLLKVKTTADATMKASAESFKADMARAVASVAQDVARNTSRKQMWQWASGAVGAAFLTLGLVGWGHSPREPSRARQKPIDKFRMRKQPRPGPIHPKGKPRTVLLRPAISICSWTATPMGGRSKRRSASRMSMPTTWSMGGISLPSRDGMTVPGVKSKQLRKLEEPRPEPQSLRLVCIGDTHGFHRRLTLPLGDILIHSRDFDGGSVEEIDDFNSWLGTLPFQHKLVIAGNHDLLFDRNPKLARTHLTEATYLQDSGAPLKA